MQNSFHFQASITLNTRVWVQLTDTGRSEHKRKQLEIAPKLHYFPPAETNGWSEWELWVLMYYFGDVIHHGAEPEQLPFGMEIKLTNPNL